MKIGSFNPLRLKKEIFTTKTSNLLIKSKIFNLKFIKSDENKIAFIIKKKIGNAVKRNNIKRRIRSLLAKLISPSGKKIYLIFIIKHEINSCCFQEIKTYMENSVKKCYELIK